MGYVRQIYEKAIVGYVRQRYKTSIVGYDRDIKQALWDNICKAEI